MIAFSIISVVYNDCDDLMLTYESIKQQTFKNYEWIVVDGQSIDGTIEYVRKVKEEDDDVKIKFITEKDSGLYDAMNKGVDLADGEYLLFLNAGDCLDNSNVLDGVWKNIKNTLPDCAYGHVKIVAGGRVIYKKAQKEKYIRHSLPASHQSIFYKKSAISKLRYDYEKYPISADYQLTAKLFVLTAKIQRIDMVITRFSLGGISTQQRLQLARDAWIVQRDILALPLIWRIASFFIRIGAMFILDKLPYFYDTVIARKILQH